MAAALDLSQTWSCDAFASHDRTPNYGTLIKTASVTSRKPHHKAKLMKTKNNPFRSAVICACFTLLNPCVQAADQVWIGSADDHNVTTPSNWTASSLNPITGLPTLGDWAPFVFGSDVVDGTVNLNRWVAINSITLNSGLTHDITIDNGPIVMGGSLVDMSYAGANLTLNAQVQQAWGDMTFNVGAGRTLTAANGVAESGWFGLNTGLTKNGAGTAVLEGASTYTLDTTINAGTLEIGGAGTLGGGSYAGTITNNGAFVHSSSANQTLAAISGNGSITQSGAGTLTLTGWGVGNGGTITVNSGTLAMPDGPWNQESHNIVVNGGTLSTSDGNSRALSWTLNGGTISSRGDASPTFWGNMMLYDGQAVTVGGAAVSTISSHLMLGAGSGFAVGAGSTLNVTGALSNSVWAAGGNGDLIKTGDGTLALSGANNNYTGATTVSAGTLRFTDQAPNSSASLSIASGASLEFNVSTVPDASDGANVALGALNGTTVTGTGTFIKSGAGVLALDGQGGNHAVTFNMTGGLIDIQGGTLKNGGWNGGIWGSNLASMNIASGAKFDFWGGQSVVVDALTGGGTIDATMWGGTQTLTVGANDGSGTFSGVFQNTTGSLGLIKTGSGTQTLTGANTYTGTTTVNGGELHLETTGTVIYTGGTIAINNGSTVKFGGGAGDQYWLDGKTIAFGAGGGTLDTGTGVNIVTGAYASGGTGLTFTTTAGTTSTISGSSGLNANGNTETFDVASTSTLNLTSFVWNSGSVIKQGGGTLTMSGTNTYTATTDVTQGTLALGASNVLPDSSHVTLGNATLDAATFTDTAGTLAIAGSGTIHLGAGAALAFAHSNSVSWSGSLTLTGTFVSGTSLRFGTDNTGLTSGQLAAISASALTSFALDANGYLTASPATGYAGWKIVNAPTGTPADDYDGDGVSNVVEYVLGGTHTTNDLGKLPQLSTPGGNMVFTFQRDQNSIDGTTTVAIEVGPDLVSWPDSYIVGADTGGSSAKVNIVKGVPTGFDTVTLTLPRGVDATKFARLVVTPAP